MVTAEPKIKLTYDDYAKTPEDERYELIDGVLIMVGSPNREHQTIQVEIGWRVVTFVKSKKNKKIQKPDKKRQKTTK
jgi:Uma2 family endonuclease